MLGWLLASLGVSSLDWGRCRYAGSGLFVAIIIPKSEGPCLVRWLGATRSTGLSAASTQPDKLPPRYVLPHGTYGEVRVSARARLEKVIFLAPATILFG